MIGSGNQAFPLTDFMLFEVNKANYLDFVVLGQFSENPFGFVPVDA